MENDLVEIKSDNTVTTSLRIAEVFKKNHKDVLDNIRSYKAQMSTAEFSALFKITKYKASNGKINMFYY